MQAIVGPITNCFCSDRLEYYVAIPRQDKKAIRGKWKGRKFRNIGSHSVKIPGVRMCAMLSFPLSLPAYRNECSLGFASELNMCREMKGRLANGAVAPPMTRLCSRALIAEQGEGPRLSREREGSSPTGVGAKREHGRCHSRLQSLPHSV